MSKNPLKIIGWIWHMYNVPFDKALGEIKDFSFLTKYTVLVCVTILSIFALTPANADGTKDIGNTMAGIAAIALIVLAVFWAGYLPFLIGRIIIYYLQKNRIIN